MFTLEELLDYVNESTIIKLFSYATNDEIGRYEYWSDIPDECWVSNITDIFVDNGDLCVEIEIEEE